MLKKKLVSVLLAMVMVLGLSVPTFAAEEEPERTADPAVQTEVETEPAGEPVAQGICLHNSRRVDYYNEVNHNNYNQTTHVVMRMKSETCLLCGEYLGALPTGDTFTERHRMQVSEYGTAIGSNGETVTTYMHACILCNYYTILTHK